MSVFCTLLFILGTHVFIQLKNLLIFVTIDLLISRWNPQQLR